MIYNFVCEDCHRVRSVRASIKDGPETPNCPSRCGPMRRIYEAPRLQFYFDGPEYIEQAYRGEIQVPGMTTQEVRATVNSKPERKARKQK